MIKLTQTGMTLIELLITLAVAAIAVGVAAPSFGEFINNQRQTAQINELLTALTFARSEAVKQTRHVTICKSADGESCGGAGVEWESGAIVFANTSQANNATREANEPILRVLRPSDGRTLRSPDIALDFISYRPTGTSNVQGTLVLCDSRGHEHAVALILDARGRARARHEQADGSALECPE